MATDIAGLFGLTPQMYEQGIRQSAMNEGAAFARMAPEDRAIAGIYSAGAGLGRTAGGMLGVEDPQMKLISARQSIIGQLDQTDPTSLLRGAKSLSDMGDQQGAFALADYARKAQSEIAQAQQRMAAANRERQMAVNPNIQIADQIAALKISLKRLEASPSSPETDDLKENLTYKLEELTRLSGTKQPDFLVKEERLQGLKANLRVLKSQPEPNKEAIQRIEDSIQAIEGVAKEGKTPVKIGVAENKKQVVYYDPNKDEQFVLIEGADGKQVRKSYTGSVDTKTMDIRFPGQPVQPKDWMDFTQKVLSGDPVMQRTSTILSDAPSAIEIIRNSTSNDFAAASLPTSIALLTGQGKNMSNADVNRFARTGGLDDRLAQDAVKFFTGGTTQVKKEQAEKFAVALYRGALIERKKKLETAAEEFGYTDSPNYKIALRNIDDQLSQFKLVKKGESSPTAIKTGDPLIDKYLFPQAGSK